MLQVKISNQMQESWCFPAKTTPKEGAEGASTDLQWNQGSTSQTPARQDTEDWEREGTEEYHFSVIQKLKTKIWAEEAWFSRTR